MNSVLAFWLGVSIGVVGSALSDAFWSHYCPNGCAIHFEQMDAP